MTHIHYPFKHPFTVFKQNRPKRSTVFFRTRTTQTLGEHYSNYKETQHQNRLFVGLLKLAQWRSYPQQVFFFDGHPDYFNVY